MKSGLVIIFLICVLCGCSGFTTDSSFGILGVHSNSEQTESEFDTTRIILKTKMFVNEISIEDHLGSITFDVGETGRCENSDGEFQWVEGWFSSGVRSFDYSFRGDTLLLSYALEGESTIINRILIGGKSGNIYGVWKMSNDYFVNGQLNTYNYGYYIYFKFEAAQVTIGYGFNEDFDYMESEFVDGLHCFLASDGDSVGNLKIETAFYGTEMTDRGVTIISKNKNREVISIKGKTYEVSLDYADYFNEKVFVTVSSEGQSCGGWYETVKFMNPDLCRAENEAFLQEVDGDGTLHYHADNSRDFKMCIVQLKGL